MNVGGVNLNFILTATLHDLIKTEHISLEIICSFRTCFTNSLHVNFACVTCQFCMVIIIIFLFFLG